jgi:hypothetical protein
MGPRTGLEVAVKKRKIPTPAGIRTPVVQLVAYSLYSLSYPGFALYIQDNFCIYGSGSLD